MASSALHQTIMAVDVAGYNNPRRTMLDLHAVHEGYWSVLRTAFAESGVPWDVCFVENTGDGAMILLPPQVAKADLFAHLPDRMVGELRRYNAVHAEHAKIQLRVAVHAGEVQQASHGAVSKAVSFTFRLLDAAEAKAAQKVSGADLALIASDSLYREVVVHDPAAIPAAYQQISVSVKETTTTAWLRQLGAVVNRTVPVASTAGDAMAELVEALLDVPCVRSAESRRLLLEMFPRREIADLVPYQAQDRLHVIAVVRTCLRFEHGLGDLLAAVRTLEPRSPQVERLAELIVAWSRNAAV